MAPNASIDQDNLEDLMNQIWRDGESWSDTTLTVSFFSSPDDYWQDQGVDSDDFTAFNSAARNNFMMAAQLWSDLADISITNSGVGDDGQIRAFGWDQPSGGWAAKVGSSPGFNDHMDVQVNTGWVNGDGDTVNWMNILNPGQTGFKVLLHEIGHTLGLDHPGNYDVGDGATYETSAEYIQDSDQYTLMSYFDEDETGADFNGNAIDAPMLHDIFVIQNIYGADLDTRDTWTTYGYNPGGLTTAWESAVYDFDNNDDPVFAIWDAGGYDTLDLSGDSSGVIIDLQPGHFSSTHGMTDNIALAYNPDPSAYPNLDYFIEAAVGGGGKDDITGNEKNNSLRGNSGDDDLSGLAGADVLYGDGGQDWLTGGSQNDTADGGGNSDNISGNTGDDVLYGQGGTDFVYGNSGADTIRGGNEGDYLWGGESDETPEGATLLEEFSDGAGNGDFIYGDGGGDAISGGYGGDFLFGGDGDDYLEGGWGEDFYSGGAGIDTADYRYASLGWIVDLDQGRAGILDVFFEELALIENVEMGTGDDEVIGSYLANALSGNIGNDTLSGLGGGDTLKGFSGADQITGGAGNDTAYGGTENDALSGGDDDDRLYGETGIDSLGGGNGDDTLDGGTSSDDLDGGGNDDMVLGRTGNDEIRGGGGNDDLFGEDGYDRIEGGSGDDFIDGGSNDDTMRGGTGDDFVGGGAGGDMVDYADSASFVRVDLAISGEQDIGFSQGHDTLVDIEYVTGSSLNDTLRGNTGANKFWGLGGNDKIEGRAGNDIINGGLNYDTASYESASQGVSVNLGTTLPQNTLGAGIDSLISIEALVGSTYADILAGDLVGNHLSGGDGDDWLLGGEGDDWISGDDGNDLVFGGDDDDTLSGGYDGTDTASYLFATAGITVTLSTSSAQNTGGAGTDRLYFFENLDGSGFDDDLTGTAFANVISGFVGHDEIAGLSGNDTISGGGDSDIINAGGGNDIVDGGLGLDVMDGGDGIDTLDARFWNGAYDIDLTTGLTSYEGETAVNFENVQTGNGDDVIDGNAAANLLLSADGNDSVAGKGGADTLDSSRGEDELRGGNGHDTLRGGRGADALFGQGGNDIFIFRSTAEAGTNAANRDTVEDFAPSHDVIDLSAIDADIGASSNNAFTFIGLSNFSDTAGELRYVNGPTHTTISGDTDGDGAADFSLKFTGQHTLAASDFVL